MFWKKFKEKYSKHSEYKVESENLAVPEVHLGKIEGDDDKGSAEKGATGASDAEQSITYDNVAIPEIHIRKRKK